MGGWGRLHPIYDKSASELEHLNMAQICVCGLGEQPSACTAWDKFLPGANTSLHWSRLEPSASLCRAGNVSPTSLSFCKAQEATSSSQAVGEGPTHIPWPADTGEEAAAATALCTAAWGVASALCRRSAQEEDLSARRVPGLAAGDGGQLLLPPTQTCTSPSSSSSTWTPPLKAAPLLREETVIPRAAGPPPATSQVSWADKGQSCHTEANRGTTSQQDRPGQGERCRGPALPVPL